MSVPSPESQLQGWKDRSANYEDHIAELDDTIETMRGQYTDLLLDLVAERNNRAKLFAGLEKAEAELQKQVERREGEKLRAVQAEDELAAMTVYRDNAKHLMERLRGERDEAQAERDALRDRVRELERQNLEDSGWQPRKEGGG